MLDNDKILEIDCDPSKASVEFEQYKDHPLQPRGYNLLIVNPPYNPENRVILDASLSPVKCLITDSLSEMDWDIKLLNKTWRWANSDVLAWVKRESDGKMFNFLITTLGHEKSRLKQLISSFNSLLASGRNIFEDNPQFCKQGVVSTEKCIEIYTKEINKLENSLNRIKFGYIVRDNLDPEFMFQACLPEADLSNEVLEKWYLTLIEFTHTNLDEVIFTAGNIV